MVRRIIDILKKLLLVALGSTLLVLVTACFVDPTPTPTASPTSAAIITPAPSPTLSPTATVTPSPAPTSTPLPPLAIAIPLVEDSVVQVVAEDVQISGIVLADPASLVLTASRPLGIGPLVQVVTGDGQELDGWIIGRDDDQNLALVRLLNGTLPGIDFGNSSGLNVDDDVLTLGFPESRNGQLLPAEAFIDRTRTDFATGMVFFYLDIQHASGTSGGPVVNRSGEIVGMTVAAEFLQSLGQTVSGGGYALDSEFIETALPRLEGGVMQTSTRPVTTPAQGASIPLPATIRGTVTIGGDIAPEGTLLYARMVHSTLEDVWFPIVIEATGLYRLTVATLLIGYVNATIEFYVDGVKSEDATTYTQDFLKINSIFDVSFP